MTKVRQKPSTPPRPFYDEEGYTIDNPYLHRVRAEYPERLVHPSEALKRKGHWKQWTRNKPLHVEIGPGKGRWIQDYSLANPDIVALAIEIKYRRFYKVAKKLGMAGAENGYILRFDANYLPFIFADGELDALYLQFPDPWYKKARHHYLRMVTPEFLDQVHQVLAPGGYFDVKTDHALYFEEMTELFAASKLTVTRHTPDLHHSEYNSGNIETIFEEKFRERGIKACYLRAEKL